MFCASTTTLSGSLRKIAQRSSAFFVTP